MIRFLRRWLLGADPEGPPLLADPLYRWEVRRYWAWRRYVWGLLLLAAVILVWCGAEYLVEASASGPGVPSGPSLSWRATAFAYADYFYDHARVALCLLGALTGALMLAPEKASGLLDQFKLTTMDPWRLALARYLAGLRPLFVAWLLVGNVLLAVTCFAIGENVPHGMGQQLWPILDGETARQYLAALALKHLELAILVGLCAAVGLRFSASSPSTPAALLKTGLVCLLLLPLPFKLLQAAVNALESAAMKTLSIDAEHWYVRLLDWGLDWSTVVNAVAAAFALGYFLKRAHRATEKAFYEEEW
jgi:hypothetical protein